MKIDIRQKYLVSPMNVFAAKKKVDFHLNGNVVCSLNAAEMPMQMAA